MQQNYHAIIINISQIDKRIFKRYKILNIKKRFLGLLKLYKITVPETDIENVAKEVQLNMSTKLKKEWYATFYNSERCIIVFRNKIFHLSTNGIHPVYQQKINTARADEKIKWDEMLTYAKTLGIPDNQLDFLPSDYKTEIYC